MEYKNKKQQIAWTTNTKEDLIMAVTKEETARKKEDANLKKLTKSPIAMNFVKKQKGEWNHQDWLNFLEYLKEKGYTPIDADRVGLLLEEKKAQYLAAKKA